MHESVEHANQGWGWVVVACTFIIYSLCFGTSLSMGMFNEHLMTEFSCTKAEIGITLSLNFGIQYFIAPLAAYLQSLFGVRVVVFTGSLMVALTLSLSAFATNMIFIYVVFGFLGGMGACLAFSPALVLLSRYFDRKLSFASAFASVGSFVGGFLMPLLLQRLISSYGWRGAMIIQGGIILHALPASLFLLEPAKSDKDVDSWMSNDEDTNSKQNLEHLVSFNSKEERQFSSLAAIGFGKIDASLDLPPKYQRHISNPGGSKIQRSRDHNYHRSVHVLCGKDTGSSISARHRNMSDAYGQHFMPSLFTSSQYTSIVDLPVIKAAESSEISSTPWFSELQPDLKYFKNLKLILYILSNMTFCLAIYVPGVYVVNWSLQLGYGTNYATAMLSLVSISQVIGRLVLGIIADAFRGKRLLVLSAALAAAGIITAIVPFLIDYYTLALMVATFSALLGGCNTLMTPILADILDLSDMASAMGLCLSLQGFAALIGPPLLALLPTYNLTFSSCGLIVLISSSLALIGFFVKPSKN